jgi:hypothetical protein
MRHTLSVTPIPVNNQTTVLLIGIFMNPSMFGGGGSPATIVLWPVKAPGPSRRYKCNSR